MPNEVVVHLQQVHPTLTRHGPGLPGFRLRSRRKVAGLQCQRENWVLRPKYAKRLRRWREATIAAIRPELASQLECLCRLRE
jgi:hypothetical protein